MQKKKNTDLYSAPQITFKIAKVVGVTEINHCFVK